MESTWNSLEIVKLIVGIALPVTIFVLGVLANKAAHRFEASQHAQEQRHQESLNERDQRFLESQASQQEKFVDAQNDLQRRFEQRQSANERVVQKRVEIYDMVAPLLNDIVCYHTFIGRWKEFSPVDIVDKKRELDRLVHVYRYLYSDELYKLYLAFISNAYEEWGEAGEDARLRTSKVYTEKVTRETVSESQGVTWEADWDAKFSENPSPSNVVRQAYESLMKAFASELQLDLSQTDHQ